MPLIFSSRRKQARATIEALDLSQVITTAQTHFGLADADVEAAVRDYRHFFYLVYWNRREGNRIQVVPTKAADALWHAHLLHSRHYREFCEQLTGAMIDHNPGLTEGSEPFLAAVIHTKQLHARCGADGFNPHYFKEVSAERARQASPGGSDGPDPVLPIVLITDSGRPAADAAVTAGASCSSCSSCGGGGD